MIYGEILAGGMGNRMGYTEKPKQFLNLDGKPILIHTLEQFILNKRFNKIIICSPKEWINYTNDIIKKYISDTDRIYVCEGGSNRNESIMSGIKLIEKKFGLNNNDVIVTHDAVRPFVNQKILNDNIDASIENDAVDTTIPATDTIVESKDNDYIESIPNRNFLFQGQTPQTFKIMKLLEHYNALTEEEKLSLTDACKIFTLRQEKVKMVFGNVSNIKITSLYDLKLANAIILGDKINDK